MGFWLRFFRAKISLFSGFKNKFLKVFKSLKISSLLFSRVWKIQRKIGFWDIALDLHFYHIASVFPRIFLCYLISKTPWFPHLSYHLSYSIRIILFVGKREFVVVTVIPRSRNTYLIAYSVFRSYSSIYFPYLTDFNFKYLFPI